VLTCVALRVRQFPLKDVETRYLGGAVTEPVAAVKGSNGTTQVSRMLAVRA
jgi:hypothetical protein